MKEDNFLNFTTRIDEFTKQPDKFLSLQEAQAEQIKRLTEDLYNFSKNNEQKNLTLDTLPRLVVENVDEEQIWQQIELQNNSICNNLMGDIAHLLAKNDLTFFLKTENKVKKLNNNENVEKSKKTSNEISRNELSSEVSEPQFKIKAKKGKSSIVDDKFFKLHEMEEFLEKLEKGEDDNDDNNEDIDYFQDSDSSSDEEQLHYNDFFDQPDDDDGEVVKENKINKVKLDVNDDNSDEGGDDDHDNEEQQQKEDEKEGKKKYNKRVKFDVSEEEDEDEEDENEELDDSSEDVDDEEEEEEVQNELKENDSEDEDHVTNQPSTFEARQERLKSRIKALESAALKEKPWQLKGEVTANSRPQNSLLEEYVEFDVATRPAPILTEKSTLKLEDIIMQRIKDKAWDDVVRKIKPTEGDLEYKKKLVLDQEKSKLSLAQIYEQEYLIQLDQKKESVVDKPEVEAPEHREIRIMMNKLFAKLDALSNFHFTPKQVKEEVKIISNIPAVNMEEVAPVATSDAALLAPEEVKPKSKGELIGKSERTATDKKRERRKKKIKQQLKFKQIALKEREKLKKDSPEGHNKNVSQKLLQKITKNRNVIQLDEDKGGKYVKSSKAFFSKLQEDTSSPVKKGVNLKKLKLGKKHSSKNR